MKKVPISGIYLLMCNETGERYVGASCDIKRRQTSHKYQKGFELKILQEAPREKLPQLELFWIKKIDPELNTRKRQTGGAGQKRSEEAKLKMSAWQKGVKRGSHSHGYKISAALKGKPKSEAHRKKAAAARKAVGNGPWNKKQRQANVWTEKRRKKMSIAMKGKPWSLARREAHERNKNQ